MRLFRRVRNLGMLKDQPNERSNYLIQSEAAYQSTLFLRDRIIEEWTAKGYKVTYDDGDSILIEKVKDNV